MATKQHMRNHADVAVIGLLACLAWTSPALAADLVPQLKGNWCDVRDDKDAPTEVVRVGITRPNEITLSPAVICNIDEIFEQQGDTHFVVLASCSSGGHKWHMELDLISAHSTKFNTVFLVISSRTKGTYKSHILFRC